MRFFLFLKFFFEKSNKMRQIFWKKIEIFENKIFVEKKMI